MKIYKADQELPVTSKARAKENYIIPPWYFKGRPRTGSSGEWSPKETIIIKGGYVSCIEAPAYGETGYAIVKNTMFETNIVVGTATLRGWMEGLLKVQISLVNPMTSGTIISEYDKLQVVTFADGAVSNHRDVTVQLYGEVVD